ncbi:MAG: 2-succinyl-5-enolpyruvyl-6-hydroxy-3-cyclohexene-1-carboxylic-acid synthase [Bacteroidales bacterium]|nr:2-succinyl-5-enolpyruvyl-6-hydroxy-3-cyclohexene-1-carboxylic-acid synthase [Bacteroidales bacterium]
MNQHIADLASLLRRLGVRHVVIAPGSRNAPLIQVFQRDPQFRCIGHVDERSAGYMALGMAMVLNEPVVVLTTSGTAALNLGPAVAEAFCRQVPLIVITADRPREWPPHFNNQIIDQEEIFIRNSKAFLNLNTDVAGEDALAQLRDEIQGIITLASSGRPGPVHLNILLKEPLYDEIPPASSFTINPASAVREPRSGKDCLSLADEDFIFGHLKGQKKVLMLAGLQSYSREDQYLMASLSSLYQVVVVAENIANIPSDLFISRPELLLGSLNDAGRQLLTPDLVLAFGGQVVSKRMRLFIQALREVPVKTTDCFPAEYFKRMIQREEMGEQNRFLGIWKSALSVSEERADHFIEQAGFCNLTAIGRVLESIPRNALVHLGNSSVIRYAQLFPTRPDLKYFSNRGTSGIDGCLSSAVGSAMVSDELNVVILGDLSFVYDSNGLWNRNFPDNLRIIVINDDGGGIFRIIEGPDRMPFFEEFSVTHHPVSIKRLSEAFGHAHRVAGDFNGMEEGLERLFGSGPGPVVLEIETGESENSRIFKQFFQSLKSS